MLAEHDLSRVSRDGFDDQKNHQGKDEKDRNYAGGTPQDVGTHFVPPLYPMVFSRTLMKFMPRIFRMSELL